MVKFLVALGADVNAEGGLALERVVNGDSFNVARYLVSQGVDVKENGHELLITASHINVPMFEYLLDTFYPTWNRWDDDINEEIEEHISDEADLLLQKRQVLPSILTGIVNPPLSPLISNHYLSPILITTVMF